IVNDFLTDSASVIPVERYSDSLQTSNEPRQFSRGFGSALPVAVESYDRSRMCTYCVAQVVPNLREWRLEIVFFRARFHCPIPRRGSTVDGSRHGRAFEVSAAAKPAFARNLAVE